ncbi:MAG: nucleoside phosphorylase [Thermoplasmata archaeon]
MPEPCFTPEDFLRWMEASGIPSPKVHDTCILALTGYRELCEKLNAKPVEGGYWSTFLAHSEGLTIARPGIGAPEAVMRTEEIISLGIRRFLFLGSGGSLREDLPIGSIVLPTSAVVDEGTSRHYLGERERIDAPGTMSRTLADAAARMGIDIVEGTVWTTDAPYREMRSKAQELSGQGILAVEMECSALFALGEFREVEVGGLVVISDTLLPEWRFDPSLSEGGMRRATDLLLDAAMACEARQLSS